MHSILLEVIFELLDAILDTHQVPHNSRPDDQDDRHYDKELVLTKEIHHSNPHD
jgi:hypothetical protein